MYLSLRSLLIGAIAATFIANVANAEDAREIRTPPSAFDFSRNHVELYEGSGGTEGVDNQGRPVIVLTSVGAKTGKLRKTPLMRVEHEGAYLAVGSKGGAPQNPVWVYNLRKNPTRGQSSVGDGNIAPTSGSWANPG